MTRWLTLAAAALGTATFVVIRDTFDLEDTPFILALVASAALAMALSGTAAAISGRPGRSTAVYGSAALVLVPVLYVGYVVLRLLLCVILGATCYS